MRVLMCPWTFPDVKWKINPYMNKKNKPDPEKARLEWSMLFESYLQLGLDVRMIRPMSGLHDMVYAANAGWGSKGVFILSKFRFAQRRSEAKFYREWLEDNGFQVAEMPNSVNSPPYFEGQGDFVTTNEAYFFGWGIRSSFEAIDFIRQTLLLEKRIIPLQLINENFYHLDTCLFSWKPMKLVMYYPQAFAPEDLVKLEKLSLDKIEVTKKEAADFVCNSVYYGMTALLGGASDRLLNIFRKKGFKVLVVKGVKDLPRVFKKYSEYSQKIPVIISLPKPVELLKGGGSYRCCSLFLD